MTTPRHTGFSLIGILVSMVIIAVLFVVMMNSLNVAVTGDGSTLRNTVRSTQDAMYLNALGMSMIVNANNNDGRFLLPSQLTGSRDRSEDTTANLFSAMLMDNFTSAEQLISGTEYNFNVWPDDDYNYTLYHPASGVYWDPSFTADLENGSNVSFAHLLLRGDRLDRWRSFGSSEAPLLGRRGPRDGDLGVSSWTIGENGLWAGYMFFSDGSVRFIESANPAGSWVLDADRTRVADNIFKMDRGPDGNDTIIAFTLDNGSDGPRIQFD